MGPGDYEPNLEAVKTRQPVASISRPKGNYQSTQHQWEERLEKFVGIKPSEKKIKLKETKTSAMASFERQMRNK